MGHSSVDLTLLVASLMLGTAVITVIQDAVRERKQEEKGVETSFKQSDS